MRLLLDTHALIWWLTDDRRLRPSERSAIADADSTVHVSSASVWEIAIKKSFGRISIESDLESEMETGGFLELPIGWRHAQEAGALPRHHEDPFDRMLIAQARVEDLALLSYDPAFRDYEVTLLPSMKL
jgi:PIN domain nuclease of toxin-antitoxin system